ncbi:putative EAL-domain containing protein YkuI [Oxobacter pfennigii]|uniref:Putative EAL-domain containing protein YkuI n=1 Tax=Oxobacter pfennigii TaxID=36849 RepID=A0A0P8WWA7_9CLOT|nr:EAL domain-containing protein [Oxobacter pfennigii]KPU42564.1 putative EAL-domain containing protein YkuI [Oxobacter pfennigii]
MQVVYDSYIKNNQEAFNIIDIINQKKLKVQFQPIVSINQKRICGLEGLIRGINIKNNEIIEPEMLFYAAAEINLIIELDRVCREKVLEAFKDIYDKNKDMLLFLNIDASILEKVVGSEYLINQVKRQSINPGSIVIEINESKVKDTNALKRFIDTYRKLGFLIALDDVGAGFSNLDRIPVARPDIIKIDISLIRSIYDNYYKQEIFRSLNTLSNKIGALVIAEGVETEEEAIEVMELGGNMIQGYYFSKPISINNELPAFIHDRIEDLADNFKVHMDKAIKKDRQDEKRILSAINNTIKRLKSTPMAEFHRKLIERLKENENVECLYVLDEKGIQVSETICSYYGEDTNMFFQPAEIGTDHSMKKYYYYLHDAGLGKYLTEPYISLATGSLCVTFSKPFKNIENKKYILCMDFNIRTDSAK